MGCSIAVHCKKCGFEKEFYIGIDFMYGDLNNLIDRIPKSQREVIKGIIKKYDISTHNNFMFDSLKIDVEFPYLNFEDKIYRCTNCKRISVKLWIKIQYNNHLYEIKYKCYRCKKDLDLIDFELNDDGFFDRSPQIPCPKCNYKYLKISPGLTLWD